MHILHSRKVLLITVLVSLLVALVGPAAAQDDEFVFGLVLVGPMDDHGWSEAHYVGGEYVMENIPGTRMVVFESLNPADAPETTLEMVVESMVMDEGAQLIITASDEYEEDTEAVAALYPDVTFINISGSNVLEGEAPENMGNIMGNMTWMKMMAGCAAGLATETGQIGYLGPLINHETRRLTNSVYLGAKYCYENFRGMDADELTFTVTWIGFWFNIPGVTLDPTEETHRFFDNGADVVISGIDTTEAIDVAGQRAAEGETVWAIPYDYEGSCSQAPEICLGVPYFNWGPAYVELVNSVIEGTWAQSWDWNDPYWPEINNNDITSVGYVRGDALTDEMNAQLDTFLAGISAYATQSFSGPYIALWQGPLNWQDGTPLVVEGEAAAPEQVWWSPQLLEGMIGASVSE